MSSVLKKKYYHPLYLFVNTLLYTNCLIAQKIEVGVNLGTSNYWGDLAPTVAFNETRPAGGFFGRINFNNTWAFNAQFNLLQVGGDDKNFETNSFRNLSFKTNITEFAALFEYNFLNYGPYVLDKRFTTYIYSGLAGLMFKPQAELDGKWFNLPDYKTEGEQYSRYTMAIPMGFGVKWMAARNIALEGQLGFRRTYTDYLDDVSNVYPNVNRALANGRITGILTDRSTENTGGVAVNKTNYKRGNADYNDWYMYATISLAIRLNTRVKCARFY